MREKALGLAARGFRVFRLQAGGREPLPGVSWTTEATTDPMMIDVLWGDEPYNIGIACGGDDGLVVVDLDCKNGKDGDVRWRDLCRSLGAPDEGLIVETPSGGRHVYLAAPGQLDDVGNSVGRVAPGIDIRADRGFVVAPGTAIADGEYRIVHDGPVVKAPEWLLIKAQRRAPVMAEAVGAVKADSNDAVHAAITWLYGSAPLAVEGDGGDQATFRVAAKLKDMGVSPRRAFDLMLHHWNPRCSPPWSDVDLMHKVRNAFTYGGNAFGIDTAEAQLADLPPGITPVEDSRVKEEPKRPALVAVAAATLDERPKARPWVVRGIAMLQQVTLLVAPGGAGKSTFTFSLANSVARVDGRFVGREVDPKHCGAVWMQNNEDPLNELALRQRAFEQHWGEPRASTFPIYLSSGEQRSFRITRQEKLPSGAVIQKPVDVDLAIEFIKARKIKVWTVDPYVESHDADENDNPSMAAVAAQYRRIAQEADVAVILVHHTRKQQNASSVGHAGEIDSARGAGAVANVARIGLTLYGMSESDAKNMGVSPESRWRWVRLDDAKANLSLMDGKPRWYEKISTAVEAVDRAGASVAEHVGVLVPGDPKRAVGDRRLQLLNDILNAMGGEMAMDLADIARRMVEQDPAYSSESATRKAVERLFAEGDVEHDQETWSRVTEGKGKPAKLVRTVTPADFSSV
jgi:hypothetical protein